MKGNPPGKEKTIEDTKIVELYFARSEEAITQTDKKYGKYCRQVAYNILCNYEDSEECVSDTYLKTWNAIPPKKPNPLKIFLGKITRNLALNKYDWNRTQKRGNGELALSLEELQDCIPSSMGTKQAAENVELVKTLNRFLRELSPESRKVFLRRYWKLCPIKEIANHYGMTESKVKMLLMRTRNRLKDYLAQEGIAL